MPNTPDALIPLNPRAYAIMLLLSEGPAHGYRIKQEVETRSAGQVMLDPGALYRTIAKMVRDGLVEERPDPETGDPRRRCYGLTELGEAVTRAETNRLRAMIESASAQALLNSKRASV